MFPQYSNFTALTFHSASIFVATNTSHMTIFEVSISPLRFVKPISTIDSRRWLLVRTISHILRGCCCRCCCGWWWRLFFVSISSQSTVYALTPAMFAPPNDISRRRRVGPKPIGDQPRHSLSIRQTDRV